MLGLISLALVSNLFGNTDSAGLLLLMLAGGIFATGVALLFLRTSRAALVGVLAAPMSIVLLFALYLFSFFASAYLNRHHQDFAANGVELIAPARQMEELYDDCHHFISYGQNRVPLFNSVAYFGGRYKLTMQVPVEIQSDTMGSTNGSPEFYLNEVESVDISPSGQTGASFSDGLNFGYAKWQKVYDSNGDFDKIGFTIDPTAVPNFDKFSNASLR